MSNVTAFCIYHDNVNETSIFGYTFDHLSFNRILYKMTTKGITFIEEGMCPYGYLRVRITSNKEGIRDINDIISDEPHVMTDDGLWGKLAEDALYSMNLPEDEITNSILKGVNEDE